MRTPSIIREWLLTVVKEGSPSDFYDYYYKQFEPKLSPKYGYAYITSVFSMLARLRLIKKVRIAPNPKKSSILESFYEIDKSLVDSEDWFHPHHTLYPQFYHVG